MNLIQDNVDFFKKINWCIKSTINTPHWVITIIIIKYFSILTVNSQKKSTCKFSLKYPYIILQTGDKNTQTNCIEFVTLYFDLSPNSCY